MIVYGHHAFDLALPAFLGGFSARLAQLPASPSHDAIVSLFVDFGEAYAAVADALAAEVDDHRPELERWEVAMQAIADALAASSAGARVATSRALATLRFAADALRDRPVVPQAQARTAEGFAHYALYPEQYLIAVERFIRDRRPHTLTCVGVRSIGAPLAHIVAAGAAASDVPARVLTVRPRGHPFDRTVTVTDRFRRRLMEDERTTFAIVDEGPGLSGSSFAAVAEALVASGADREHIVLFPSWNAPPDAVRSERGRATLARYPRAIAAFEDVWRRKDAADISAGGWRSRVYASEEEWPAVQPQHERRKYLLDDDPRLVLRFAGLGRYGRGKLERARLLADAGFSSPPASLDSGFIALAWATGSPVADGSPALLQRVAAYLAFVRASFETGRRARVDDLVEMVGANLGERVDRPAFDEAEIAVDGRLLPHEWIQCTDGRLLKADALDHHADDFLPGARDIAWDVAGAIVELRLVGGDADQLVATYAAISGDRSIARRIAFYRTAYLAYRVGYATMAAESLRDTAEGQRFRRLLSRYRCSSPAPAGRQRPSPPR